MSHRFAWDVVGKDVASLAALLAAVCSCSPAVKRRVWPRNPPPIHAARTDDSVPVLPHRGEAVPRVVVHAPFRDNRCNVCHVEERGGGMLLDSADKLCRSCHAAAVARAKVHPIGRSCLECHARHVSMAEGLLAGTQARICGRCHDADSRAFLDAHQGYPVGRGRCTRCHDPHGHDGERPLRAEVHRPASRCTNCHVANTEDEPLALIRSERETCGRCHPGTDPDSDAPWEHAPFGAGCSDCHEPHASDRKHLLVTDEKTLCLGCHPELARKLAGATAHAPAQKGSCHVCHTPHGSADPELLAANAPDLCLACHVRWHETPAAAQAPRDPSQARCLYCHDPHGSGHRGLLRHELRRVAEAPR